MERYLYISIILFIFICIFFVCNGCMNLYEGFAKDDKPIKISDKLILTNDPGCKGVPANPCVPTPCQNGGLCSGNGTCSCTDGWTGDTCEDKQIPSNSGCYCDINVIGNNNDENNPSGYKLINCDKTSVNKTPIPNCTKQQCSDAQDLPSNCGSPQKSKDPNKYYGITAHKDEDDNLVHSCGENCAGAGDMAFSMSDSTTIKLCNMEKCDSRIKPSPKIDNDNYNLQFMNNTGNTMYVSIVQSVKKYYNNWNFYIGNNLLHTYSISNPTETLGNVHYFLIPTGDSLLGKPKIDGPLKYLSGNAFILKNLPENDKFTYDGLTSLEFTYDNTLNSDISGVAGLNLDVDMEIFNALDCDGLNDNKTLCSIDNLFEKCSAAKFLFTEQNNTKCYAPGKGDHILSPTGQTLSDSIKVTDSCGLLTSNCATCGTGEDKCNPTSVQETDYDNCYANNIKERWGCYKWWGDQNNNDAKNWFNLFGNTCPIYRWPYDELKIKGINSDSHYDNFKIDCPDDVDKNHAQCNSYRDSMLYKCQKKGTSIYPGDKQCNGSLEQNPIKPLVQCSTISKDTLLKFTIHTII